MTYVILESIRETILKKLESIAKKASKYGAALEYSLGDTYAKDFDIYEYDEYMHTSVKVDTVTYEVFDLEINSEGVIKKCDSEVLARIEHFENANIVNVFSGEKKLEWTTLKPHCDHCGGNHVKTITFIVKTPDGLKQVGRTCLKDYSGIDPQAIGIFNQIQELVKEYDAEGPDYDFVSSKATRVFEVERTLALAIATVRKQGYVSTTEPGSNKEMIYEMIKHHAEVKKEDVEKAKEIIETVKAMDEEEAYKANLESVKAIFTRDWFKPQLLGYIAYCPVVYDKYLEKKAKRENETTASGYVGSVGDKLTVNVTEAKLMTSWENDFGYTYLYKFSDKDGNVYIWYASKCVGESFKTVKGTVKAHSERDGVKQTVLTRCKVA